MILIQWALIILEHKAIKTIAHFYYVLANVKKNKQLKYAFEKLMLINETQKIEITLLKQLNNLLMEKIEYNKTAKSSINISKSTLNVNKFNRERILKNKTC